MESVIIIVITCVIILCVGDNVCIICREDMTTACKKLPCGHIFHTHCLRSWFQRQQTCPTCRMDVLRPSVRSRTPGISYIYVLSHTYSTHIFHTHIPHTLSTLMFCLTHLPHPLSTLMVPASADLSHVSYGCSQTLSQEQDPRYVICIFPLFARPYRVLHKYQLMTYL